MSEQERNDSFRAGRHAPTCSARREKDALRPPPGRSRRRVRARDFVLLIMRGDRRHRQVHPRWWTRHNTSMTRIIKRRCIRWFYRVSRPIIVHPPPEPEITMSRPVYQDVLVDQDWGRHPPDPRQVISTMRDRVEHALQISEVVSNPLFLGILEGLRFDYIMFDQQSVPTRRFRSPQE